MSHVPNKLPEKFEFSHNLCFWLHDELVAIAKGLEELNLLSVELPMNHSGSSIPGTLGGVALFEWLEANGYEDTVRQMYMRSLFPALLADLCNFVYEALDCSRKRKCSASVEM